MNRQVPTVRAVGTILRKDLLTELRARESVPAMTLFSVMTFVVFHFALDRKTIEGDLASGVIWVTVIFASVLATNRLLVAEREEGGFESMLLAPIDRTAILFAKLLALLIFLTLLELVALPVFAVLLLDPSPFQALPELIFVLLLANLGIAVVGTLVASLTIHSRAREVIVPLLALPLMLPIVIGAAEASQPLLSLPEGNESIGRWLALIGLYDTVFLLVAYAVYDFLLED